MAVSRLKASSMPNRGKLRRSNVPPQLLQMAPFMVKAHAPNLLQPETRSMLKNLSRQPKNYAETQSNLAGAISYLRSK